MYSTIVTALGFGAIVAFVGAIALLVAMAVGGSRAGVAVALRGQGRHPITWAWVLAVLATLASLYLSDIVGLLPCTLCWYQRIAMYPLAIVLAVAAFRGDVGIWRYGLLLSAIGLTIAIYHVTIQWQPALDVVTCTSAAPCTGRYLAVFGFISIPVMAGSVFLAVSALMLLLRAMERAEDDSADAPKASDHPEPEQVLP